MQRAANSGGYSFLELGRQLGIAVEQLVVEEGSLSGRGAAEESMTLALRG